MSEYKVTLNEREQEVLLEAVARLDMSPEAVIRHWFRMGQMIDHFQTRGELQQQVLLRQLFDTLHRPKMAPVDFSKLTSIKVDASPLPTKSCGCTVGECICDNTDFS